MPRSDAPGGTGFLEPHTDPRLLDLKASVERLPLPEAPRAAPAAEPLRTWNRRA